jgi:alpha-tubulin suppressor-like RCC1 family protein
MQSVSVPVRVRQIVRGTEQTTYALDEEGAVWAWGATSEDAIPGHAGLVETPVRVLP